MSENQEFPDQIGGYGMYDITPGSKAGLNSCAKSTVKQLKLCKVKKTKLKF